nr:MAG: hypothetical protein DIU78_26380 [Pseudomonadota bacterium]
MRAMPHLWRRAFRGNRESLETGFRHGVAAVLGELVWACLPRDPCSVHRVPCERYSGAIVSVARQPRSVVAFFWTTC